MELMASKHRKRRVDSPGTVLYVHVLLNLPQMIQFQNCIEIGSKFNIIATNHFPLTDKCIWYIYVSSTVAKSGI